VQDEAPLHIANCSARGRAQKCLCSTILSNYSHLLIETGLLMTAYLKSLGMSEAVLSLFRGLGAVAGVAATFTYPLLHSKLGAPATTDVLARSGGNNKHDKHPCSSIQRCPATA
jgi:Ferroportin1 (FPN1)